MDFLRLRKVPVEELGGAEDCARGMAGVEGGDGEDDEEEAITVTATKTMTRENKVRDVLPAVKSLVTSDRDYLEKGTKAFTSYIRAYKEHECSFIFPFSSLDLGELATAFCLLR